MWQLWWSLDDDGSWGKGKYRSLSDTGNKCAETDPGSIWTEVTQRRCCIILKKICITLRFAILVGSPERGRCHLTCRFPMFLFSPLPCSSSLPFHCCSPPYLPPFSANFLLHLCHLLPMSLSLPSPFHPLSLPFRFLPFMLHSLPKNNFHWSETTSWKWWSSVIKLVFLSKASISVRLRFAVVAFGA